MGKRKLLVVAALVIVGLVAFFFLTRPSPAPPRALPNPNGYDEIIRAAKLLPSPMPDLAALNETDLRMFLQTNAAVFQSFREALKKPCVVSDWLKPENSEHMDNISAFKRAAVSFAALGKIAEKEKRYGDAAAAYLDAIRVGNRGLRGGVLIDYMVATACETIGIKPLKTLSEKLSANECHDVIAALEEADRNREPYDVTAANEKAFILQGSSTIRDRLFGLMVYMSERKTTKKALDRTDAVILLERQTLILLAEHAYEIENKRRPANVSELMPKYLKAIPQDPTTKTNLSL